MATLLGVVKVLRGVSWHLSSATEGAVPAAWLRISPITATRPTFVHMRYNSRYILRTCTILVNESTYIWPACYCSCSLKLDPSEIKRAQTHATLAKGMRALLCVCSLPTPGRDRWEMDGSVLGHGASITTVFQTPGLFNVSELLNGQELVNYLA